MWGCDGWACGLNSPLPSATRTPSPNYEHGQLHAWADRSGQRPMLAAAESGYHEGEGPRAWTAHSRVSAFGDERPTSRDDWRYPVAGWHTCSGRPRGIGPVYVPDHRSSGSARDVTPLYRQSAHRVGGGSSAVGDLRPVDACGCPAGELDVGAQLAVDVHRWFHDSVHLWVVRGSAIHAGVQPRQARRAPSR